MFACYSDNQQKGSYCVKAGISVKQFESIKRSFININNISRDIEYWCLIDNNINQLKESVAKIDFNSSETFVLLNGAFSNLLSAYYLWKCYNHHKNDDIFQPLQSEFRNEHIECYLIAELRNYISHNGFAISEISFDVLNNEMSINIDPNNLIDYLVNRNKAPNSKLKTYLNNLALANEKIDAISLTDKFQQIYLCIQKQLWKQRENDVRKALKLILEIIPSFYPDLYNSYIISDDGKNCLYAGHQLHHFVLLAKKYYPEYLKVLTSLQYF